MALIQRIVPDITDVPWVAVHHKALPIVVHQQEAGVGLLVVFDTELDERPFRLTNPRTMHQILNNAIVSELGEHLEFNLANVLQRAGRPQLTDEEPRREDFRLGNLVGEQE